MKAKKILLSLTMAAAMSVSVCAAKDAIWQYNQNIAINMSSAKVTSPSRPKKPSATLQTNVHTFIT